MSFWGTVVADLEAVLGRIKAGLEAVESELVTIWTQAFPTAVHAAIQDLIPLAQQIMSDLSNSQGLSGKALAQEALAQLETAAIKAGKDFAITFGMQAVSIVLSQMEGTNASGNGGNLAGGNQTPPSS